MLIILQRVVTSCCWSCKFWWFWKCYLHHRVSWNIFIFYYYQFIGLHNFLNSFMMLHAYNSSESCYEMLLELQILMILKMLHHRVSWNIFISYYYQFIGLHNFLNSFMMLHAYNSSESCYELLLELRILLILKMLHHRVSWNIFSCFIKKRVSHYETRAIRTVALCPTYRPVLMKIGKQVDFEFFPIIWLCRTLTKINYL